MGSRAESRILVGGVIGIEIAGGKADIDAELLVAIGFEEEGLGVAWGLAGGGVGDRELESSIERDGSFGEVEFGVGIGIENLDIESIRIGGRGGGDELDSATRHGFGEVASVDELDEKSFEADFVDGVFVAEHR